MLADNIKKLCQGTARIDETGHIRPCKFGEGLEFDEDGLPTEKAIAELKKLFCMNEYVSNAGSQAHANKHKGDRTESDILNTILTRQRNTDGQFANEKQQMASILETLMYNRKAISEFVDSGYISKNYGSFREQNERKNIYVHSNIEMTEPAKGFAAADGFIYSFEDNKYATIVLIHAGNQYAPLGFALQTAYPGIGYDTSKADTTDNVWTKNKNKISNIRMSHYMSYFPKNISDITKQTPAYQNSESPIERTMMLIRSQPNLIYDTPTVDLTKQTQRIKLIETDRNKSQYEQFLIRKEISPSKNFDIYISKQGINTSVYDKQNGRSERKNISWSDLDKKAPSINYIKNDARLLDILKKTKTTIQQETKNIETKKQQYQSYKIKEIITMTASVEQSKEYN